MCTLPSNEFSPYAFYKIVFALLQWRGSTCGRQVTRSHFIIQLCVSMLALLATSYHSDYSILNVQKIALWNLGLPSSSPSWQDKIQFKAFPSPLCQLLDPHLLSSKIQRLSVSTLPIAGTDSTLLRLDTEKHTPSLCSYLTKNKWQWCDHEAGSKLWF